MTCDTHKSESDHLAETRERVLAAALPEVMFDGWSEATLRRAVATSGVEAGLATLAFPRGALDLAAEFHKQGDRLMTEMLAAEDLSEMRIRDRIHHAVMTRLKVADMEKEAVRRGAAFFALPVYAPEGARLIWGTADAIWNALGDPSRDYNWYTKRATLAGVYSATVLVWLNDSSADMTETRAFLDNRIDNVMQIEKVKGALRKNPLARLAFAGPRMILRQVSAPDPQASPGEAPVGFPGRG